MSAYVPKLVDGNIPAKTVCPWDKVCGIGNGQGCRHLGVNHTCAYSCAMARSYESTDEYKHNKKLKMLK